MVKYYTEEFSVKPKIFREEGKWSCTLYLNGCRYDVIRASSPVEAAHENIKQALKVEEQKGKGMSNGVHNGVLATIARWLGHNESYIRWELSFVEQPKEELIELVKKLRGD